MENSVVTIECSNSQCQAANPLNSRFCERCGTPLVRNYLRASGEWVKVYKVGELIDHRYLLKQPRVALDTKPGLPPNSPEKFPSHILPYLKLFPYRLHIPQVYSYLPSPDEELDLEVWFLEYGTVPTDQDGELKYLNFLPEIGEVWEGATPLRQLNWLWQMARLWQPLQEQGVVSSLLEPSLLRANGPFLQLLELQFSPQPEPSFDQLGQIWSPWTATASPSIADFLQQLCQHLEERKIQHLQLLLALLERGMQEWASGQQRSYTIFTDTDTGPKRRHNEDACYPAPKTTVQVAAKAAALAIVCDGVGGQERGEVASQLAVETLVKGVSNLSLNSNSNPLACSQALTQAVCTANDAISSRNDSENRQERRRMGTTLVLALARAQQMYLAHVGDSRAYWIAPEGCYQVTVDDDLASREVHLGYLLYRDAIHCPNSGALLQALGMGSAASLYPSVQRLIVDGEALFLLCSDGLSDGDRVEQYWESELAPILSGERDVETAGRRLLEIANQQNGHDNVTVALIHCRVQPPAKGKEPVLSFPKVLSFAELQASLLPQPATKTKAVQEPVLTPPPPSRPTTTRRQSQLPVRLAIVLAVLAAGAFSYYLGRLLVLPLPTPTSAPSPQLVRPTSPGELVPAPGDFLLAEAAIELAPSLSDNPDSAAPTQTREIPKNTILKVLKFDSTENWIQVQVCQLPPAASPSPSVSKPPRSLAAGELVWLAWPDSDVSVLSAVLPKAGTKCDN